MATTFLAHEFLSLMLGFRRSGVTDQLHIFKGRHVVRSSRGSLRVRSREKLLVSPWLLRCSGAGI
ncbi:hypothetical protein [Rhizobium laguerreae]|nr:hypothetical protein [Rhizobium laguerreae]